MVILILYILVKGFFDYYYFMFYLLWAAFSFFFSFKIYIILVTIWVISTLYTHVWVCL